MVVRVEFRTTEELYNRIVQEANRRGISVSDLIALGVAEWLGEPALARRPKKPPGRRPRPKR